MIWMTLMWLGCSDKKNTEDTGPTQEELDAQQAEACHEDVENWDPNWAALEERVLELVNQKRAQGADCGQYGVYEPTEPLEMNSILRCSARYHAKWMGVNRYYDHSSPGGDLGEDPFERMENAGFTGMMMGENVAFGYATPDQVVNGWMSSDGHCSNIMEPEYNVIGVGYAYVEASEYKHMWTQNFGWLQ